MIYDAAISYDGREANRATALEAELTRLGLTVWLDRNTRQLGEHGPAEGYVPAGSDQWAVIREAIDSSATLLVLDSPGWHERDYTLMEYRHARDSGKRVIAIGPGYAPPGGEPIQSAVRLPEDSPAAIHDAIADGLELARAHARLTLAAHVEAHGRHEGSSADAKLLSTASLARLGIGLTAPVQRCIGATLKRERRRRRTLEGASVLGLTVLALLAAIAVLSARTAQQNSTRARSAARHVAALAAAAASESTPDTAGRIAEAEHAVTLEQNPTTIGALRDAYESLSEASTTRGLPQTLPEALAISNDGRLAVEVLPTGAVVLIAPGSGRPPRILTAAQAGGQPAISPDSTLLALIAKSTGAVEIMRPSTGHATPVAGSGETVSVLFASNNRAVAVRRDGQVLSFDPASANPKASPSFSVGAPVRAATLAGIAPDGRISIATLDDGSNIRVSTQGAPAWQTHLPVNPGPYLLGWETLRVCSGELSVLTTGIADNNGPAFAIPYTVNAAGAAQATGSMIHSYGLICLPGGGALVSDYLDGQESFPTAGGQLPALTPDAGERVPYAVDSSENDQWAAAAGRDGSLTVLDLQRAARSRQVESAAAIAPGTPPVLITRTGRLQALPAGRMPRTLTSTRAAERPVRGAYLDPKLGTVIAAGRELFLVSSGRVTRRVTLPAAAVTIHPGVPSHSALALLSDNRVLLVALSGPEKPTPIPLPADMLAGGAELTDAAMLNDGTRVALANSDGYLDLLTLPGGHELARRKVAGPGNLVLLSVAGHIALGTGEGTLELLDPDTLTVTQARTVLGEGIIDLEADPSGSLIAVLSRQHAAVLSIPELFALAHTGALQALGSVTLDASGEEMLLSQETAFLGGGDQASITTWPLCGVCAGSPRALRAAAATLSTTESTPAGSSFLPG